MKNMIGEKKWGVTDLLHLFLAPSLHPGHAFCIGNIRQIDQLMDHLHKNDHIGQNILQIFFFC